MKTDEKIFVEATDSKAEQSAQQKSLMAQIANLNQQQREIVLAPPQDIMVIAGAGTGKTHVVISRIAFLLSNYHVRPWEIFAVTFTNKAAHEMVDRICNLLGWQDPHRMEISTFHSFCYRMLSCYTTEAMLPKNFLLLTPQLQESLLKNFLKEQNVAISRGRKFDNNVVVVSDVLNFIDRQKNDMIRPNIDESKLDYYLYHLKDEVEAPDDKQKRQHLYEVLYACYEHLRISAGAVDFADLINYMVMLLKNNQKIRESMQKRFRYIFVDEFQDTNAMQYELLMQLKGPDNYVFVVGDDDQSIYEWRGAKIANVQRLIKDFPNLNIYALTINYRSTRNILNFANALISCNKSRLINKFLVNPLTYEGLCNCEKIALQHLFDIAKTDRSKLQRIKANELLCQYLDRDLSTLGEQERANIFQYAIEHKLLDPQLIDCWKALSWGDINATLNSFFMQNTTAKAAIDAVETSNAADVKEEVNAKVDANTDSVNMLLRQAFPEEWMNRYQAAHMDVPLVQLIEHDVHHLSNESICICSLIKYLHEDKGVPFEQIAILYRKNSLSSIIEVNLSLYDIPYQIYGGLKFYERAEILSVLAYLRLLLNPRDDLSFYRIVNLPRRGIGEATLKKFSIYASSCGLSKYEALAQLARAPAAKQRPFKKLLGFYSEMEECRSLLKTLKFGDFVDQLVQRLNLISFYKEIDKYDNMVLLGQPRVDNILQLIVNAKNFEQTWNSSGNSNVEQANTGSTGLSVETLNNTETILRAFIDQSCLSAGVELNQAGYTQGSGVQMMTIHAAKGLEFTAVIVIGCEEGILPALLSENIEEERRLAYVAFTRAKSYLFACYAQERYSYMLNDKKPTGPSEFLHEVRDNLVNNQVGNTVKGLPFEERQFTQESLP